MDPLTAFLKGLAPDAGPAPAQRPDASARWRQELERAQWSQRRSAPAAAAPTSDAQAPQAGAASSRADARSSQSGGLAKGSGTASTNKSAAASEGTSVTKSQWRTEGSIESKATVFNAVGQARLRPQEGSAAPQQAQGAPRPQRMVWSRVHVHTMLREGEADVWVRDASLGERGRRRLAVEMGQRLRAAGLRPGALYLNGELIDSEEFLFY